MQKTQLNTLINEMLIMQACLNEMTNGKDWRTGVTQKGKVIDWRRCIVMETAELIDSYPWKHWKAVDAQTDIENVRVELVDIWHFLLSLALENFKQEEALDILIESIGVKETDAAQKKQNLTVIEQVKVHEAMMQLALSKQTVDRIYLQSLTAKFLASCEVAELSLQRLYEIYIAKNVLNKFRQDHGYKEGTYIKEWNGKEDNVVMFEIIASLQVFTAEELYAGLKTAYIKFA